MRVSSCYEFGPFRLHPSEHLLLREGKPVPVTPKAFDILVLLVENSGRLLRKDDLLKRIWPDSFVEESNLTVNISTLRKVLGRDADGKEFIETVPRRGYRFTATVEELAEDDDGLRSPAGPSRSVEGGVARPSLMEDTAQTASVGRPAGGPAAKRSKQIALAAVVLLGIALAAFSYALYRRESAGKLFSAGPHSLAILPFQNLRQDPDSDFLGFSLADAIITRLGYVSALTVRPSVAVQKYRNQALDVGKVATDLKVDTLLTGNFIRDGDHVRITTQLIDAKSDKILWRRTLDLKYADLLTLQDDVAQQIIRGLELNLSSSEAGRFHGTQSIDPLAYEYYLRGVDLYSRSDFPMAIKMLEKSAEMEPDYALTWAHLGRAYTANASFKFGGRDQYRQAQAAYQKALSLQPGQMEASIYMANLLTDTGKAEEAVPLLREAVRTNPNHAEAHWELGYAYRFAGMLQESVSECERARQLDPGVKLHSSALNGYLYLGRYDVFLASLPAEGDSAFDEFYRGFGEYYKKDWAQAEQHFDRAFELDPSLFQAQLAEAFSFAIKKQDGPGLKILRDAESKIEARGVRDPEAAYKLAQAYAALGDKASALRVLRGSIENGFFCYPYFAADPLLDNLRHEPGFEQLMTAARERHEAFKRRFF
ncbi:MAG TPA: winged helix-turn-helix domain-containing protein [Terriglobia bacterium]|nr:winged helix-turn-helix domain-containing protein [Terriglobia bacterium]